jgi:hypothetical protein
MLWFSWDERKAEHNLGVHGIDFLTATQVFEDPDLLLAEDRAVDGEERIHALGLVPDRGLILVVALYEISEDETEEHVRIISARPATRAEEVSYYRPF